MREEQRLRVFENRVLGKIFGFKMDDVTGKWRGIHKRGVPWFLFTKYYSGIQIEKKEMGSTCGTYRAQ
jgi:hypothetical protein